MRAMTVPQHGGLDALTYLTDFPEPKLKEHEVLIKVEVTGLNHIDIFARVGYPGIGLSLPHIPGADVIGTIVEVGRGVTNFKTGDRVVAFPIVSCGRCPLCREGKPLLCLNWLYFGLHLKGSYAEYVTAPAENLLFLPDNVSFMDAITIPVTGLTAFHALTGVGNLKKGEAFFIWGGSGGVGTMAIQIAKQLEATVIATGGSDQKLEVMKKLGADYVFNRFKDDIPAEVAKIAPYGVDVVLDYIATQTFPKSFEMLKKGGRMLLCGMHTGKETTLSIHMTYLRCLSLLGFYLGTREEMQELINWIAQGKIKPYIGEVLDLKEAALAHHKMETGNMIGKLALKV